LFLCAYYLRSTCFRYRFPMRIWLLKKVSHPYLNLTPLKSAKERDSLILSYFKSSDIEFTYVVLDEYSPETQQFSNCWEYNDEKDMFISLNTSYSPDIVRNLCSYHTYAIYHTLSAHTVICSEHVSQIADNKLHTYEFLCEFQPESMLLKYFLDDVHSQKRFWEEIILKPIYGNWWMWVELYKTQDIIDNKNTWKNLWFVYIVQKKINTQDWCPWITKANHDLRLYYVGTTLIDCVIREKPNTWDFKVNVSQGWTARYIPLEKLPQDLIAHVTNIIMSIQPKEKDIFSLDFMYDSTHMKWYLIEMNSNPWFRNLNNTNIHSLPILQAIDGVLRK